MKKLINRPGAVVSEMIDGLLSSNPGLVRLSSHQVVIRAEALKESGTASKVRLISGGGSGHEPAHAGYIGPGMLDAAVLGEVFTSPSSDSVFAAIKAVASDRGVLLIVKNYTGDRLNFGLAAEMARAEGIEVETVVVDDDLALDQAGEHAGARGLAGTVLVHKIAGAAAAEGAALADVAGTAQAAIGSLATMGLSLSAGTVPAVGKPSFHLGPNEIELGLGIHGEPGVERIELQDADTLAGRLLERILGSQRLQNAERVVAMVNSLGATTPMELAIIARRVAIVLKERGRTLERLYQGLFLSSLEMAGVSISLLAVDDRRLHLLDARTTAPAWPNVATTRAVSIQQRTVSEPEQREPEFASTAKDGQSSLLRNAILAACDAVRNAEPRLTAMDQIVGDGDLGSNLRRGAEAIGLAFGTRVPESVASTLHHIGLSLQRVLGGSSGPLYGVLFLRAASILRGGSADDLETWAQAITAGCDAIGELGGAQRGDRTMLDALLPFRDAFALGVATGKPLSEVLPTATTAAERGADATAEMRPRRGRSSYLGERAVGHPDPGAVGAAIWLRAVSNALTANRP